MVPGCDFLVHLLSYPPPPLLPSTSSPTLHLLSYPPPPLLPSTSSPTLHLLSYPPPPLHLLSYPPPPLLPSTSSPTLHLLSYPPPPLLPSTSSPTLHLPLHLSYPPPASPPLLPSTCLCLQFVYTGASKERKKERGVSKGLGAGVRSTRLQDRGLQEMRDDGVCLSMHQPWASLLIAGIKRYFMKASGTPPMKVTPA